MATRESIKVLRILSALLLAVLLVTPRAQAAIEIFAGGKKYTSFKAYKLSENLALAKADVSRSRIEGLRGPVADRLLHRLCVLSVENGMARALEDFYHGQEALPLAHQVSPDDVENAIKTAVSSSPGAKLLIAQEGKFSIMTLTGFGRSHGNQDR